MEKRDNWTASFLVAAACSAAVNYAEAQYDPLTDISNLLFFVHSDDATNGRASDMSGSGDHVVNYTSLTPNIEVVDPDGSDANNLCDPINQIVGPFPFPYQRAVGGETLSIGTYRFRVTSNTKTNIFFAETSAGGRSYPFPELCTIYGVGTSPHADWSLSGSTYSVTDRSAASLAFQATGNETTYPAMDLLDVPDHIVWDASNNGGRKLNARLQNASSVASSLNHTTTPLHKPSFTLFFFARIETFGTDGQRFVEFHNSATTGNYIWFGSSGSSATDGMKLVRTSSGGSTVAHASSWTRDTSYHLYAVTWDGTTNQAEFFQDGTSKGLSSALLPSVEITGLNRITIVGPVRGSVALAGTAFVGGVGAATVKLTAAEQTDLYAWFMDSFDL